MIHTLQLRIHSPVFRQNQRMSDVPNCCKEHVKIVQSPYPVEVAYSYPYCQEGEKLLHSNSNAEF